jgi:putative spermidine/putrescine transport system substrate-binding protein
MQEAQQKAYFEPFEKLSGIKVRAFPGTNPTKIKAMVETGNVEWDIAQLSRGSIMNLQKRGDYFEKIDYSLVDDGIGPEYRFEYGLEMLVWAEVMAYRTDVFKGVAPKGWADFWNTKTFPGDRAMIGTGAGNWPELEFALMAAGVPADKLYPLDIDKAFASYDQIKKAVVKWWDTGAVPIQLLTDREVAMTTVWNGRMAALQAAGVPAAISWEQGLMKRDAWGIPKGAKNAANAMKFAAYSTMAIPQARISFGIPYGSVNGKSDQYIPPERLAVLPSAPAIKSQLVNYDYDWWIDNRDMVVGRFDKWLLS